MNRILFAPLLLLGTSAFVVPPSRYSLPTATKCWASKLDQDRYTPEKVTDEKFDTIVIGSGIGGLAAASLLSQFGQKVLVLEQHYVAGGAMHTFPAKGYRFATGIHYIGEMGKKKNSLMKQLVDSLTPKNNPVVWDRMDDNYDTAIFGDPSATRYEMTRGEKALKQSLMDMFPNEKKAIRKFFRLVKKCRGGMHRATIFKILPQRFARFLTRSGLHRLLNPEFAKYTKKTVQQVVEELTDDKELQAVLAYNWGDYGVEPNRAPFLMQALLATHYLDGAFYPHGGPSMIAKRVIEAITDCGGKVLVSAPVKRILLDDGKASGVEMESGQIIRSNAVVSDAGFINTVNKLLPPDLVDIDFAENDLMANDGRLHPGASAINLFVGLKGDHESLNLPKCQYWIHPSIDMVGQVDKLKALSLEEALKLEPKELGPIFVGVPCTKDTTTWTEEYPGKVTMEIITLGPWHWFDKFQEFDKKSRSHGPEYEAAKTLLAEKVWKRVVDVLEPTGAKLPATLDKVDHFQVGTPLSFAHYYRSEKGAFYGLDHDLKRFDPENFYLRLRPDVHEVPGLFLAGQDVWTVGFGPSAISGLLCAQKVLGRRNPLSLLRKDNDKDEESLVGRVAQPVVRGVGTA